MGHLPPYRGAARLHIEADEALAVHTHSNIILSPPFPVDESSNQTTYTYLDTTGRPTLVLHKTACSEKHGLEVLVSYDYSKANLLRKPFVIGTSLAGVFFLAGLMRRINWSLKV